MTYGTVSTCRSHGGFETCRSAIDCAHRLAGDAAPLDFDTTDPDAYIANGNETQRRVRIEPEPWLHDTTSTSPLMTQRE
jgi:hypothetical protein